MLRFGTIKLLFTIIALTTFQFGCGGDKGKGTGTGSGDGTGGGHGHVHNHGELKAGPHGGTQIELEFKDKAGTEVHKHLEIVINHTDKSFKLYILGEDSKTPAPIKTDNNAIEVNLTSPATTLVSLTPAPLDGEKDGNSSVYTGTNDAFAKEADFEGTLAISVDSKIYQPKFDIGDHDKKDEAKADEKK